MKRRIEGIPAITLGVEDDQGHPELIRAGSGRGTDPK